MLSHLGLAPFDAKLPVARITDPIAVDRVLEAVELFRSTHDRAHAVDMLRQAGLKKDYWHGVGIKRLLGVIEMARQDPKAVAESLVSLFKGLGI